MAKIVRINEPLEVHQAFKVGKARKKILQPRAHDVGYLKKTRKTSTGDSARTAGHREAVDRSIEAIAREVPALAQDAVQIYTGHLQEVARDEANVLNDVGKRVVRQRYAALETARELAAASLGAGSTFEEAAAMAGVTAPTVKRWLEGEDFRARVNELRSIRLMSVGARIEAWMERRTSDPDALDQSDPKVTIAIYDRIQPVARVAHAEQTNVTVNNYPDLMGRLGGISGPQSAETPVVVDDTGAQGGGFPIVGPDRSTVAG